MAGSKLEMNQTSCSQRATVTLASVISGLREVENFFLILYFFKPYGKMFKMSLPAWNL